MTDPNRLAHSASAGPWIEVDGLRVGEAMVRDYLRIVNAARALIGHDAPGPDGFGTCRDCSDEDEMCDVMGELWRDLREAVTGLAHRASHDYENFTTSTDALRAHLREAHGKAADGIDHDLRIEHRHEHRESGVVGSEVVDFAEIVPSSDGKTANACAEMRNTLKVIYDNLDPDHFPCDKDGRGCLECFLARQNIPSLIDISGLVVGREDERGLPRGSDVESTAITAKAHRAGCPGDHDGACPGDDASATPQEEPMDVPRAERKPLRNRTYLAAVERATERLKREGVPTIERRQVGAGVDAAMDLMTGAMTRLAHYELNEGPADSAPTPAVDNAFRELYRSLMEQSASGDEGFYEYIFETFLPVAADLFGAKRDELMERWASVPGTTTDVK